MRKLCFLVAVLIAASSAQAQVLTNYFTNLDFDESTAESYPGGFDNTNSYDIPGWQDLHDTVSDAGIENAAWWSTYDNYSAFMHVDDGAYNLGTYTIQAGDAFTISVVAKSWDGSSECTASLFYDDPTNVIGSFVTSVNGTWTTYTDNSSIAATPGSVGGSLGIIIDNTASPHPAFLNFDEVSIKFAEYVIDVSPTGISDQTSQTVEATIVDKESTMSSATLYLDGSVIANNNTPSGTGTNVVSSLQSGLSDGVHTAQVVVVGSPESVTNTWTFEVSRPPFDSITTSPTGIIVSNNPTLKAVVIENFSTVDSAQMWLDGASVTPSIDRSLAPTTTISYAASGLSEGVHTGFVTVAGDPSGSLSNQWTFTVVDDDTTQPINLVHHWAFNETGSATIVPDLVGGANGTVIGTNHAWTGSALDLEGGGYSSDWNSTNSSTAGSYVDLPNGIISNLPAAATFEAVYIADTSDNWMRLWDFGSSSSGEDVSDGATQTFFLTPASGYTTMRMAVNDGAGEFLVLNSTEIIGELVHLVCIYDSANLRSLVYVNGELVAADIAMSRAFALSDLSDVNNWLGRAQYPDPMFNGQIDDFRIYSGVMTSAEVAARYAEVSGSGGPTVDPEILSIGVSGGTVTLTWTDEGVGTYTIQRKTNLTDSTWSDVLSGLPAGTGSTNVTATTADQEFYQVKGE